MQSSHTVRESTESVCQDAEAPWSLIKGVGGVMRGLNSAVKGAGNAGGVVSLAFHEHVFINAS